MGQVGPIHHIQASALLRRDGLNASFTGRDAQGQWPVARVQVGQLTDQGAVIIEDLRAPKLGTGQLYRAKG